VTADAASHNGTRHCLCAGALVATSIVVAARTHVLTPAADAACHHPRHNAGNIGNVALRIGARSK